MNNTPMSNSNGLLSVVFLSFALTKKWNTFIQSNNLHAFFRGFFLFTGNSYENEILNVKSLVNHIFSSFLPDKFFAHKINLN